MESQLIKHILPNDIQYFRYLVIIIVYPKEHNIPSILQKLNLVEPSINFTYELRKNTSLLFLDTLLVNNNNKLEFKAYHKMNIELEIALSSTLDQLLLYKILLCCIAFVGL